MIFCGEGGVGKSLFITEATIRLAMGWEILGLPVLTSHKIKIFQQENSMSQVQFRIRKMIQGFQITALPDRIFFSDPKAQYNLKQKASVDRLKKEIVACGADVFILDPLSSFHAINENDNILMRNVLDTVTHISRETGAAAIIIDHFGKPSQDRKDVTHRLRGASSKRDWADTLLSITHRKHESKILRQIDFIKVRNGPMRKSVLLERNEYFIHEMVEEDTVVTVTQVQEVLEAVFGGRVEKQADFIQAICHECDCSYRTAQRALYRAIDMNAITEFAGYGKSKGYSSVS